MNLKLLEAIIFLAGTFFGLTLAILYICDSRHSRR